MLGTENMIWNYRDSKLPAKDPCIGKQQGINNFLASCLEVKVFHMQYNPHTTQQSK